ncbi:hypothetical protein CLLU_34670 [Clostridium luticellarii]|uniref:Uncharacterized protein n=1 Tax=Clostridium luticellarii TaxID=1691940 RepID=A0A2T0B732_9CLOT|nr:hypothetical protein CLLU_34670 [Clostridium luticellarii]
MFSSKIESKIVVDWKINTKLHNIIQLALKNNNLCKRIGNNKKGYKSERRQNFYYYHPLQRGKSKQTLWLEQIIEKLKREQAQYTSHLAKVIVSKFEKFLITGPSTVVKIVKNLQPKYD